MFYYERMQKEYDNEEIIIEFLERKEVSEYPLIEGNQIGIKKAYDSIQKMSLERMIEVLLKTDNNYELEPSDVPQYSNLKKGLQRISELLEFSDEGMTYYDIGYKLVKADKKDANRKYGENHSKLAEGCSLVTINYDVKPRIVKNTSLGKYLAYIDYSEKIDLYKKLLLRDRCVRKLLYLSNKGRVDYRSCVSKLSDKTADRRKFNVKEIVDLVLEDTKYEILKDNIEW